MVQILGSQIFRHIIPPATAFLLSLGILLLNKDGIALIRDPLVAVLVMMLAAAAWYLFRPRDAVSRGDREISSDVWRIVVPVAAFLAGPAAAVMLSVSYGLRRRT